MLALKQREISAARQSDRVLSGFDGVVLAVVFSIVSVAAEASLPQAPTTSSQPAAIIVPPWTSGPDAVSRSLPAGNLVLRNGHAPFIVIVAPPADNATPERPDGALLILALTGLAGCLDAISQTEPAL